MGREIACRQCGGPIASRAALAVAGQGMLPVHAGCYAAFAAARPWYRKPGWPVNRWRSLLPFNALLVGLVVVLHLVAGPIPGERWPGLGLILLVVNGWLVLARLVSYLSLERHLPAHAPAGVGRRGR